MSTSDKKEEIDETLTENYYKRTQLWKGNKAIKELVKATKYLKKNVIQWLASQALWQVHLPSPRKIIRPHFTSHGLIKCTSLICYICLVIFYMVQNSSIF